MDPKTEDGPILRQEPSGSECGGPIKPVRSCSPWTMYQRAISERPLLTKSLTAAVVSGLGEVAATGLRRPPPPPSVDKGLHPNVPSPGLLRRTVAFAAFGLLLNGPVFHWWYGELERIAARCRKSDQAPGNAREVTLKVALDRLLLTPPYLAVTLFVLRVFQGLGVRRSARETRALYKGALITNWKVWTLAQLVNFNLVPVEFRPIFGNVIAFWWNIYLALLSSNK